MRAAVGDRMVVAATRLDGPVRDGEILEVGGADGGGPYLVRWSESGRESLFFPGVDAHVEHLADESAGEPSAASAAPAPTPGPTGPAPTSPAHTSPAHTSPAHTREWHVDVYLYEAGDATSATAVLHAEAPTSLRSHGEAHRRPGDEPVPEIGDEIAVARALRTLADRLLATASDDIAEIEHHPVHLAT